MGSETTYVMYIYVNGQCVCAHNKNLVGDGILQEDTVRDIHVIEVQLSNLSLCS